MAAGIRANTSTEKARIWKAHFSRPGCRAPVSPSAGQSRSFGTGR